MINKLREDVAKQLTSRRLEINRTQSEMVLMANIDRNVILGIENCTEVRFNGILKYAQSLGAKSIFFEFEKHKSYNDEVTSIVLMMCEKLTKFEVAKSINMSLPTLLKRLKTGIWKAKEIEFILDNFK